MKSSGLNFRHLYYFWVVAQEGSVTRAAERLGVAVQTISTQLGLLEKSLGKSLLAPQGRRLAPTAAGRTALAYADQIFLLGEQMQEALADDDVNARAPDRRHFEFAAETDRPSAAAGGAAAAAGDPAGVL